MQASLIFIVLIAAVVVVVVRNQDSGGPSHPEAWDPRVLDIVHFDEDHRGLTFKHPVYIDFLTADAYSQRTRSDSNALTEQDKKDLENAAGELRAFGLVSGNVDLAKSFGDLADSGTLAFYDSATQRVSVRGTDLTVNVRVTLAHELTHALQDQTFGIGDDRFNSFKTSEESSAFRTIVEGDAVRIEDEYISSLSDAERTAYQQQYGSDLATSQSQLKDVPAALQALQEAPYAFGPELLKVLKSDGGNAEINQAFTDPPSTDTQLVDPRAFLAHRDALAVDEPALPAGVSATTDSGDLGALTWYLLLAQRIDPFAALGVADGWGGDAYIAYSQDGHTCVQVGYQGASSDSTKAMHAALDAWAAAGPAGAASVSDRGDGLLFTSCDPGASSDADTSPRALEALYIPILRVQAMGDGVDHGYSPDSSWDYGDCSAHQLTFEQYQALNAAGGSADLPADLTDVLHNAFTSCQDKLH